MDRFKLNDKYKDASGNQVLIESDVRSDSSLIVCHVKPGEFYHAIAYSKSLWDYLRHHGYTLQINSY